MPPYIASEHGQRTGVWSPPTSTLDWCEENYITTLLIAELWNTMTNLLFIIPAFVGIWYTVKYKFEARYLFCYVVLLVLGIGSFLFHATLKLSMQLLDELPMLILSAFMLFALQEMGEVRGHHSTWTYVKTSVLIAYTVIVSLVYIIINDPTFHEVAYALMVIAIAFLGFKNLVKYSRWKYMAFAVFSFSLYLLAFILWNIDNHFCPSFRSFRSTHSMVGFITQFHAWWHCLAAIGTYCHLVLSSRLRMEYLGHTCAMKYKYGMPYIEVSQKGA